MVGHLILDQAVGVRVPAPQPRYVNVDGRAFNARPSTFLMATDGLGQPPSKPIDSMLDVFGIAKRLRSD